MTSQVAAKRNPFLSQVASLRQPSPNLNNSMSIEEFSKETKDLSLNFKSIMQPSLLEPSFPSPSSDGQSTFEIVKNLEREVVEQPEMVKIQQIEEAIENLCNRIENETFDGEIMALSERLRQLEVELSNSSERRVNIGIETDDSAETTLLFDKEQEVVLALQNQVQLLKACNSMLLIKENEK